MISLRRPSIIRRTPSRPAANVRSLHPNRPRRIKIDSKFVGDVGNGELSFDAVSRFIQWWREDGNRAFARYYRNDSSTHAALRRQTHVPRPAARAVIEAGHGHGCQDFWHVLALDDLLSGNWIGAEVGQRCAHHGQ